MAPTDTPANPCSILPHFPTVPDAGMFTADMCALVCLFLLQLRTGTETAAPR
jgi:hypothetical protein